MLWFKRGEAVEKRRGGGGGGGGCCLRAAMVWEVENWRSAQHPGKPPDYIKGGFVLHKLYHGCRSYDFC